MACHDRGEMRVLSQAHAVALAAVAGLNTGLEAAALAEMAQALPEDHPIRADVARFMAVQGRRFPEVGALQEAGRALRQAVALHLMPVPAGQGRADIHG